MKVYISGPMTGIPQFNILAFDQAKAALEALGYEVVSPPDLDPPEVLAAALKCETGSQAELSNRLRSLGLEPMTHADFIARDLKIMCDDDIEAVFVLPGWEKSEGSAFETFVAFRKGIPIYEYKWALNLADEAPFQWLDLSNAWGSFLFEESA